ncbi:Hsp70 family protein [Saccharothrix australiensis]|uniref:Molecular chaperone DnaK n=1 Tax=Saccharothrix australiensis TaxID=2072 RepID=A0A495W2C5_9PSEU|nr:Hsp70 family protein [Saccharothrix australiensis]RKT55177.1 molecular chaperone DnaK [Saccharothrix australiensis]
MSDSDTIDYGIDLGTTNSAIAVVEGGDIVTIKNNDGWDITPSAVWMPKPDVLHVGRRAYERVETDPDNSAAEFKLEMGLADARRAFAGAGRELTPQQLSAEVLKSLRADATHHRGNGVPPDFAVITVPAAFTLNQNKATTEAAALAGFDPACPLVQEPTAAAFAYGFRDSADRGYWMVFDFGGGTFDAAVVSKRDGDLRVLNHAGDSYLGGKLIDWALVDRVLAPAVGRELGLRDFHRDNPAWRTNFAVLKRRAEEAKIQLSRTGVADVLADLSDGRGGVETFEYNLRRDELDAVAEPFYARAIKLCRAALAEAALDVADVDRLVLVGGVTLAPGLRERLADPREGIGIRLDTSLDPTTVVARGAAVFASTIRRPRSRSATAAPGEFVAELSYDPSVTTTTPTVGGRLISAEPVDWTEFSVTLSNPDGQPPFRSAQLKPNAEGAFVTDVDVDAHRTSRFTVELTDGTGTRRALTPDTLSITHRDVEFGGVRLAHSLGIQLADRAFAPMLRKGATLPTRVREVYRTSGVLRRDDADAVVRIPVVQGERTRADRNRLVGVVEIRPRDVRIDLPAGTDVEVTFDVDASSVVTVVADVPLVDAQFEAEISLDDVRTVAPPALRAQLGEAEARLSSLRDRATTSSSVEAQQRLDKLDDESAVQVARDQVDAAKVDTGAAASAEERLRELNAELDDIEEALELPALVHQLHAMLDEAQGLADQGGTPADRQELGELRRRAQEAIDARDAVAVRAQIDRVGVFLVELERRGPDWPVKLFYGLQSMVPPSTAASGLVREGNRALAARDARALDAVNQRLIRLLPQEEQDKVIGLRKA